MDWWPLDDSELMTLCLKANSHLYVKVYTPPIHNLVCDSDIIFSILLNGIVDRSLLESVSVVASVPHYCIPVSVFVTADEVIGSFFRCGLGVSPWWTHLYEIRPPLADPRY